MNTSHQPDPGDEKVRDSATAPANRRSGTPEERQDVRYTPWPTETQLPLPVFREDGQWRETVPDEEYLRRTTPSSFSEPVPAQNLRRHLIRAAVRVGALATVDLAAFGFLLGLMHIVGLQRVGAATTSGVGYLLEPYGVQSFALALAVGLAATGNYGAGDSRRDGGRLFVGCMLAACIFSWRQLWAAPLVVGAELAVLVFTLGSTLVVARYVTDRVVRRHRARTHTAARTILVGPAADCTRVYIQRLVSSDNGFHVLGFVETKPGGRTGEALGRVGDLERLLQQHDADTVVVCGDLSPACLDRVLRASTVNECELLAVSPVFEMAGVHPTIMWRRGRPLIALRGEAARGGGLLLKRVFDVVTSAAMLVALSPVLLAVAVAVRLESAGPVVFGHLRAGRRGRFFRCLKFRSMHVDAEERLHADPVLFRRYVENDFKLPAGEDPRITRVGRWLRRTSLDELPQLVNVIRGDMSLVGPRPIVREELNHYADDQPLLLSLRPGVTGLWQVNGRSSVPYPARTYIELEYVQTWTLMRDIEILLRTVPAVLRQRGAS
jgi:exopolysaccharide biosynthesis polyprenyl glycosylphosphotransferase